MNWMLGRNPRWNTKCERATIHDRFKHALSKFPDRRWSEKVDSCIDNAKCMNLFHHAIHSDIKIGPYPLSGKNINKNVRERRLWYKLLVISTFVGIVTPPLHTQIRLGKIDMHNGEWNMGVNEARIFYLTTRA